MGEGYYRIGQASKILGISSYHLRRLCELGLIQAEYSGHQWQLLVSVVENLERTGVPPIPAGEIGPREPNGSHSDQRLLAAPSDHAITSAEERLASEHRVEITRNRAEQIKAEREIETQLDWFRQRAARQEAERLAREAEQSQRQAEAAAQRERERWCDRWMTWALDRRPWSVPREAELQIQESASALLASLNPKDPEDTVRRLVAATVDKTLQPWVEAVASKAALEQALDDGCFGFRDDLRARATQAAYEHLREIRPGATYQERLAIAHAAVRQVKREFEYGQTIQAVASAAAASLENANRDEREEAQELIQAALAGMPVGTRRRELERAAAEALAPLRAAIERRQAQEHVERARKEDRAMRAAVLDSAKSILYVNSLPPDTLKDVQAGISKLPDGAPQQEVRRVRDEILERANARAKNKSRSIEDAAADDVVLSYLNRLHKEFELGPRDPKPLEVLRKAKDAVRAALERELNGTETPEHVAKLARRAVRRALDIED